MTYSLLPVSLLNTRLINTTTYEIEEFFGDLPPYAILSHTWEGKELTLWDLQNTSISELQLLPKFEKIRGCCGQARNHNLRWAWINTCCIDKTSSAELSEAINSIFDWYARAAICLAYLSDVMKMVNGSELRSAFFRARWLTRGWTLQELIAPSMLAFYDRSWNFLGLRREPRLQAWISELTGVKDFERWNDASVACKFSWASKRETTREEDKAYSLMGLFGVNMPLLYGEGRRAFLRLQLEIIRMSDDESIFAWIDKDAYGPTGILAETPQAFEFSGEVRRLDLSKVSGAQRFGLHERPPYSMTNKGIHLQAVSWPAHLSSELEWALRPDKEVVVVPLLCNGYSDDDRVGPPICVHLLRMNPRTNQWVRVDADFEIKESPPAQLQSYIEDSVDFKDFYIAAVATSDSRSFKVDLILDSTYLSTLGFKYDCFTMMVPHTLELMPNISPTEAGINVNLLPVPDVDVVIAFTFRRESGRNQFILYYHAVHGIMQSVSSLARRQVISLAICAKDKHL